MNKKFKHKITGFIAEKNSNGTNYILIENKQTPEQLPLWIVENSFDWEEIKEFPKILSFRRIKSECKPPCGIGDLFILKDNNLFSTDEKYSEHSVDEMLCDGDSVQTGHFEIYQVQTSKDKIWTVGDKCIIEHTDPKRTEIIKSFKVSEYGNITVLFEKFICDILDIKQLKLVLFTTEDNVDICLESRFKTL